MTFSFLPINMFMEGGKHTI